jgi:hypothetical protein
MKLGGLSPLSPADQLTEARGQLEMLFKLARGGDVTAAASIPDAIRQLLEISKGFNASGPGFVADFERSQQIINRVTKQFGDQLSVEERMLAEMQKQNDKLEEQLKATQLEMQAAQRRADEQIQAIENQYLGKQGTLWELYQSTGLGFDGMRKSLDQVVEELKASIRVLQAGFTEVVKTQSKGTDELLDANRELIRELAHRNPAADQGALFS